MLPFRAHMPLIVPGGGPGIQLVGMTSAQGDNDTNAVLNLTALTGGLAAAPSPGDYTIIIGAASSGISSNVTQNGGYGLIAGPIYTSTSPGRVDASVFAGFEGGTPNTAVNVNGASNNSGGNVAIAVVLRGIDPTTPLDVAVVQGPGNTASALANPPAITPVTPGAWILAAMFAGTTTALPTLSGPANMTDFMQRATLGSTRGTIAAAALKKDWTTGAFDPDALTGTGDSTGFVSRSFTIAIRPAP